MINLEWLRTFKAAYEEGSITKAAKALYISQPGASVHLSSLESAMGCSLFERQPRRLAVTEAGRRLYAAVVEPLTSLEKVEKEFGPAAAGSSRVTVGMCSETFQISLEKYLPRLDFDLVAEFGNYEELLEGLEQGRVDVVVTPQKQARKGVVFQPVSQENLILVAGPQVESSGFTAALAAGKEELRQWLKGQLWYGISGSNEHFHRFWRSNFGAEADFSPKYIVPNFFSIIRSLQSSPGLAVIPDFLCRDEVESGALTLLWRGFAPLTNILYLASRKGGVEAGRLEQIVRFLKQELPELVEG